ncbi:MAG: polysaccharide biosynthesis/export family protein [Nitrospirales bacterium]|nr:polysaccharide biosynthesis/export family protein [Nitrospirales bacterium]
MQQQLLAYRNKLADSEHRLQEFQRKHGIISHEEQRGLLLRQRQELDSSLKGVENQIKGFKDKLAWVKSQISQVPEQIPLSSVSHEQSIISSAKQNLLSLQLQEQQLLGKYTESSPHIRALHREMELIEEFIKKQEENLAGSVTTGKNPLYQEMEMQLFHTEAELVSAEAQSQVILQQIKQVDDELNRLTGLTNELENLRRQVTADEKNYLAYLTKVGTSPPQDYTVQVGDQLDIKFFFNPELNESIMVRQDGRIAMQLIGEISVVGQTVEQIRVNLMKEYAGQLKNPEIAVLLRSSNVPAEAASQR